MLPGKKSVVFIYQFPEEEVDCSRYPARSLGTMVEIELDFAGGRTNTLAPLFLQ